MKWFWDCVVCLQYLLLNTFICIHDNNLVARTFFEKVDENCTIFLLDSGYSDMSLENPAGEKLELPLKISRDFNFRNVIFHENNIHVVCSNCCLNLWEYFCLLDPEFQKKYSWIITFARQFFYRLFCKKGCINISFTFWIARHLTWLTT